MRRLLATLLVSVFSFSLMAPLLLAGEDANLPACCRRGGAHRCAMMDMDQDEAHGPSSGASLVAHTLKCPYFPKGGALPPHSDAVLLAGPQSIHAVVLTQRRVQPGAQAGYPVAYACAHPKRGPPVL